MASRGFGLRPWVRFPRQRAGPPCAPLRGLLVPNVGAGRLLDRGPVLGRVGELQSLGASCARRAEPLQGRRPKWAWKPPGRVRRGGSPLGVLDVFIYLCLLC